MDHRKKSIACPAPALLGCRFCLFALLLRGLGLPHCAAALIFTVSLVPASTSWAAENTSTAQLYKEFAARRNIGLFYAAADINHPESVFGHVFLVAHNQPFPEPDSPVIEFYGMTEGRNSALIRTITDVIPGQYTTATLADKVRIYDNEARDLYFRPLRTEVDKSQLIERIELFRDQILPYDFLNLNCAYYIELLVTGSTSEFQGFKRIRQPFDVFLNYGDRSGETHVKSTERRLVESQEFDSGDPSAGRYFAAKKVLRKFNAGTGIDDALRYVTTHPQPEPLLPNLPADWPRKSLKFSIGQHHTQVSFAGFDTASRQALDPITAHSSLIVGRIQGLCENGQMCRSAVDLFDLNTFSARGFSWAKRLTLSVRNDHGFAASGQIGFGLGYSGKDLAAALVPVMSLDTRHGTQFGWESRLLYRERHTGVKLEMTYRSHGVLDALTHERGRIIAERYQGGPGLGYSKQLGYTATYRWLF